MARALTRLLLAGMLLFPLSSCFSDSGGGDEENSTPEGETDSPAFSSNCGTVRNNVLENPVPAGNAEAVTIMSTGQADAVIVTPVETSTARLTGPLLVKLHGIEENSSNPFLVQLGTTVIEALEFAEAWYVSVGVGCDVTLDGGGAGVLGAVFTDDGESLAELLLETGAVVPTTDACGGELLSGCYQSIEPVQSISPTTVSWFLWKPDSERDGNVVVLVDPRDISVRVTSGGSIESFVDFGPSNGRGTTARGSRPGCAYGQATVEFFDSQGRQVFVSDGRESIQVNGCDRLEFRL